MATFRRLLGFLAPYRSGVILSFVLAAAAMVASVAIPWLVGRGIDRVRAHDTVGLRDYAIAVAVAVSSAMRCWTACWAGRARRP